MDQLNLPKSLGGHMLLPGTYPAIASGNESKVVQGGKTFVFKFEIYVKGFNIPDVVTIDSDGSVRSKVLGGHEIKHAIERRSESALSDLSPGSYAAQASGHTSRVIHNGIAYTFKFENGVRGLNIRDTVTVSIDGSITSYILGKSITNEK